MATSDSSDSSFWSRRATWVGFGAFICVFLGSFFLLQNPVVSVLAGLAGFGAGYFLTPQDRKHYSTGVPVDGANRGEMNQKLRETEQKISTNLNSLPRESLPVFNRMIMQLREVVGRWSDVEQAPEQRTALESITFYYLPNTLDVFLKLPNSDKAAMAPEWIEQLKILGEEVSSSRDLVVKREIEAMKTNGHLLRQRFEDGDLQMFKDNGL